MPANIISVIFHTNRRLTEEEVSELICSIVAQVEEPVTRCTDESSADIVVDADYTTAHITTHHSYID